MFQIMLAVLNWAYGTPVLGGFWGFLGVGLPDESSDAIESRFGAWGVKSPEMMFIEGFYRGPFMVVFRV